MTTRLIKKVVVCLTVAAFLISCGAALAAEKPSAKQADKQWFVNKDSTGRCSVREQKGKTATTIGGPYATKEAAQQEKAKLCPKPEKPEKGKTPPAPKPK